MNITRVCRYAKSLKVHAFFIMLRVLLWSSREKKLHWWPNIWIEHNGAKILWLLAHHYLEWHALEHHMHVFCLPISDREMLKGKRGEIWSSMMQRHDAMCRTNSLPTSLTIAKSAKNYVRVCNLSLETSLFEMWASSGLK